MIIEFYFRKLIQSNISTEDISRIILNFAQICDAFMMGLSDHNARIENKGLLMTKQKGKYIGTVFGTIIATPEKGIYY